MLFKSAKLFASKNKKAAAEIEPEDSSGLHLVRANDHTGQRAYYFMLIEKQNVAALKQAFSTQAPVDLKSYGEIVSSGYGEQVPESLRIRMRVEHGWNS